MALAIGDCVYSDPEWKQRPKFEWRVDLWTVRKIDGDTVTCDRLNSSGCRLEMPYSVRELVRLPKTMTVEPEEDGRVRCAWEDDDGPYSIIVSASDLEKHHGSDRA